MLWVDENCHLSNNYYSTLAQFKSLEKRLDKDAEIRERYSKTISDDVAKDYVIAVSKDNSAGKPSPR